MILKVLGDQQTGEGLRIRSEVMDHAECDNQSYIVDN